MAINVAGHVPVQENAPYLGLDPSSSLKPNNLMGPDYMPQGIIDQSTTTEIFSDYQVCRHLNSLSDEVDPETLARIRTDVGSWLERTGRFDYGISDRMQDLIAHVQNGYGASIKRIAFDTTTTLSLVGATKTLAEAKKQGKVSFEAVPDLGSEDITDIVPITKYVPQEMRRKVLRGMPSYVTTLTKSTLQETEPKQKRGVFSALFRGMTTIFRKRQVAPEILSEEPAAIPESRRAFDTYFALRTAAVNASKVEGPPLKDLQEEVRSWLTENFPGLNDPGSVSDYRTYSSDMVKQKMGGLVAYLREHHSDQVDPTELWATEAFISSSFAMYEDRKTDTLSDRDGSFAFVVPIRMSRNYPMYGSEAEPVIPALRYVPNELRAWMMRGCPPLIIDTYQPGPDGKRGYLVYAPVSEDMQSDLSTESNGPFMGAAQEAVNDAVDFAHNRLGAEVIGLGATLPMITYGGKTVNQHFGEKVIVTTGHGGTVELLCATIDANTEEIPRSIGILGLGAIGAAAAIIASHRYDGKISIFDPKQVNAAKLKGIVPDRFAEAASEAGLIEESEVIISAVSARKPLDLDRLGVKSMEGKLVVDDSQPASMNPRQVQARGGRYLWVIGQDGKGIVRRMGYDYGTMLSGTVDLFGCEAEAAVLAAYYRDLQVERGYKQDVARAIIARLAINGRVTAESAGRIGILFKHYGIVPAQPQAFGRPA